MTIDVDRQVVFGERPEAVERIAPGYFASIFEAEHLARYRWAARQVIGRRVLDVACGTGYGARTLTSVGAASVVGVDLHFPALRFGADRYSVATVCANGLQLPFADAAFNAVVSLETIEHVTDGERFLGEIRRVLRHDGVLLLSTPERRLSSGVNPYHIREYSLPELLRMLRRCGFKVTQAAGQHWVLRPRVFSSVRGLRRLRHEIERRPAVLSWRLPLALPRYWCLSASC